MKKKLFAIALLSISFYSQAQITFQKIFDRTGFDLSYSVQQTADGGYIIVGETTTDSTDIYLIKTDTNGDTLWTKNLGGTGNDYGNSVQQTADGGYIVTGYGYSFGAGGTDVYLIKTDVNGNPVWTKTFGGTANDGGAFVQQTTDGGYIITGFTGSFGAGLGDIYLIKTDANGNSLWTKTFGGTDSDDSYSVQQTTDGGYIVTGYTASFGAGGVKVYLIKTDANGDSLWTKTFGGTGHEWGSSVRQTTDGGYIISGYTNSFGVGLFDAYFIKTDANGNSLWTKTYGGADIDDALSVQLTSDGGYISIGETGSFGAGLYDAYLIKTDANGDTLWTKSFGGTGYDYGYSVQQTTDGGYIITGWTNSFGAGTYGVYLIKTDSLGNSGCNHGSTVTFVTTPATIIGTPATIVTSPATIVTTPAAIVGSGAAVNSLCTTVGISEIVLDNSFIISPNPSAGNFIISYERTITKGTIEIVNILGENVHAENISNETKKEINLKNISSGIYFVKLFDGNKYYCKKIIIEQD